MLPTIVTGLTNDAEVVQTETFAPILYVMKFSDARRGHRRCRTTCRRACRRRSSPATCKARRAFLARGRLRLRHRQRQHRHLRRRDRRRVRRREGNRRWPRVGLRRVEGLHAPPDQHHQLLRRAAAGAGHQVRPLTDAQSAVNAVRRPAPRDRQPGLRHPRLDLLPLAARAIVTGHMARRDPPQPDHEGEAWRSRLMLGWSSRCWRSRSPVLRRPGRPAGWRDGNLTEPTCTDSPAPSCSASTPRPRTGSA